MRICIRYLKPMLGIAISVFAVTPKSAGAATIYTSTEESKCFDAPKDAVALYGPRGPELQECKGVKGWKLFLTYTNERSWIDLKHGDRVWTTEEEVVEENRFGFFPNVSNEAIEWNITAEGQPSSIIFKVNAQGPGTDGVMNTQTSRYFAVKLKKDDATFCGFAKTKEKARALAASGRCDKQLKRLAVPKKSLPATTK